MIIREATVKDIPQIQMVRHSVKENILSDPALVTDKDCEEFIMKRGKGWVCEIDGSITGFSIVDLKEKNIWALFVHPDHEGKGIGKMLHDVMMNWYFTKTTDNVWLGTEPNTKAAKFYKKNGWKEIGVHGKAEIKFEMSFEEWNTLNDNNPREQEKQSLRRDSLRNLN